MTMQRDGFVTRISHDIYRKLVGGAQGDTGQYVPGGRVLDHQPKLARWKWLREAIQQSIEQARAEANEHREIAREQRFVLDRIEFEPEGDEVRQSLERVLRAFDGEARVGWIKRIWPGHAQDGISLEALQVVCLSPAEDAEEGPPGPEDPYDRALHAKAMPDPGGALAIRFVGTWQGRGSEPAPARET